MDGEKLDLCLLLFRNLYGCNFLRPTIHEESTEVCMKTYIFNFFFHQKRRLSSSSANMPIWRYIFWKCSLVYKPSKCISEKRSTQNTENMLNVYRMYSLGDQHNHEKKILLCAKNVKKKRNKYFFDYHWIFENPVKYSNSSNILKWWRGNILLFILFF